MRILREALAATLALAVASGSFALDISLSAAGAAGTETANPIWPELRGSVAYKAGDFGLVADLKATWDGSYGPLLGNYFKGLNILIERGGLSWDGGPFSLVAGKLPMRDEIDSPYSLFLSGRKNAALTGAIRFEDERFFFSDRWIALNYDSRNGAEAASSYDRWPDRSAVLKNYGMKLGDFRFGVQDLTIYTDKYYGTKSRGPLFDLEYFLLPLPGYLIQYIGTDMDTPWEKSGALNDNSIMGLFAEWKREGLGLSAQILVDDININRYFKPDEFQNPDKIAWSLGSSLETEYGIFRFDHAGATKYCFSSSGYGGIDNLDYGYTFYPDTVFEIDGLRTSILPEDNYVGYLHGENNLAFRGSWTRPFGEFDVDAALEFTLSGSKSPANPWHEYRSYSEGGSGTKFLNESVLEKKLVFSAGAEWRLGSLTLFAKGSAGYVWNKLALKDVTENQDPADPRENGIPLFAPSSNNAPIGTIALGATWTLRY